MPVAKLSTSESLGAMKSEEGNDSFNILTTQATAKEALLPSPKTEDNPVQWIQLLNGFDQPDLLSWPSITPVKVQMQKCEKCSQEFCSSINYRRHIRVHRRSLKVDKESCKKRDLLGVFWDKLSYEEAKEILLFNGVMIKEIPGASVVRALSSSLHKSGVWTLPQIYVRAGSSLLGIIQAKPHEWPIPSQELFSILDDASERTFLCAGTTESLQKYLFDGETARSMLELKNLVASTSFLFEQQLVKAWITDKDAEALRCQKLLVEEEEAAKKRLAELLERKKQKKLRQKEHRLKEQFHRCKGDFNAAIGFDATDRLVLAESFGPPSSSDSSSHSTDGSANVDCSLELLQFLNKKSEEDIKEALIDFSSGCSIEGDSQTIEPQMVDEQGHQHSLQVINSQRQNDCGYNMNQMIHNLNPESTQNNKKDKMDSNGDCLMASLQSGISCKTEENSSEIIIGSISIAVQGYAGTKQLFYPNDTTHLQRTSTPGEMEGIASVERGNEGSERAAVSSERCMQPQSTCDREGMMPLSSSTANAFLAQRWKEAISADHVKLVLSPVPSTLPV